jgi:hypothetical protein
MSISEKLFPSAEKLDPFYNSPVVPAGITEMKSSNVKKPAN